jgi:hypothetical protein
VELLIDIAGLTPGVKADLDEVREKRGTAPTFEEAQELMRLAQGVGRAYHGKALDQRDRNGLLPRTVRVGDVELHSLTIAGRLMLRLLIVWNGEDGSLFDQETWDVLQAWVFAHCRDRDAMALCTADAVSEAALAWAPGLTCDPEEISAAIEILTTGAAPDVAGSGGEPDEADTVRALAKLAGGTPDHWLFDVPESQAAHVMDAINTAAHREANATARANGKQPPPDSDPKLRAVARYNERHREMMSG